MASIRKRVLPSGKTSWQADYRDSKGARRSRQFATRRDADAFLLKARTEVSQGKHTPDSTSITVSQAADLWLRKSQADGLQFSTVKSYSEIVNLHIVPLIGTEKLSRLTTAAVENFKDKLIETRSRAMARRTLTALKGVIKEANRRGLVAQNVAENVTVSVRRAEEIDAPVPTKQQILVMLEKSKEIWPLMQIRHGRWVKGSGRPEIRQPLPWRPILVVAIFTGMRASEIRGLTWANIDFDKRIISVRQRADLWGVIGAPKSKAGRRDIQMTPGVFEILREWREVCPKTDLDLVFPAETGRILNHENLSRQGFLALLKNCDLWTEDAGRAFNFHSLRHAAASLMIDQGWSPKKIQTVLGHSSIQVTFDIYGHLFKSLESDQAAAAKLESDLLGVVG